ncbi:hypothetical protein IG631_08166 [Alternaria alternata]|nr:hypothetical protein IG631_08166 [Alternaria alternata]
MLSERAHACGRKAAAEAYLWKFGTHLAREETQHPAQMYLLRVCARVGPDTASKTL